MATAREAPGGRRWAGRSAAERRAARRARLVEAAFDLLGTRGWQATTVRAVCRAAGLNPRYFYESFATLDELVVAVYDRLVEELREAVTAAVAGAGADLRAVVRAAVACTVDFVADDPRRGRILYEEALGNEALNRRRIESGFAVAELVAGRRRASVHRLAAAVVVGGLTEVLVAWLDGRIRVGRERLVDEVTELFVALAQSAANVARAHETASGDVDR